jgi:hypothetical protein
MQYIYIYKQRECLVTGREISNLSCILHDRCSLPNPNQQENETMNKEELLIQIIIH